MKRIRITKPLKILFILFFMNLAAFISTQSMANKYAFHKPIMDNNTNITLLEKGWQIINWSYNLLKFFKKPQTSDFRS